MISTIGNTSCSGYPTWSNLFRIGKRMFAFYRRSSDNYAVFRTSFDGITWSSESVVSHIACGGVRPGVLYDGTYVWVLYYTGTDNLSNPNATTVWSRKGTPSGGSISWATQVEIRKGGGWWTWSLAKTNTYVYLSLEGYNLGSAGYYLNLYRTTTGSSWTTCEEWNTGSGYMWGHAICKCTAQYADGIVRVYGAYSLSYYSGGIWNGSSWLGGSINAGTKTSSASSVAAFSLVYYNSEAHFLFTPSTSGGNLRYNRWNGSWVGETIIESGTLLYAASVASPGTYLYTVYQEGTTMKYKKMVYATHTWDADGTETTLASGETTPQFPVTEQYPPNANYFGVNWRSTTSPFPLRYTNALQTLKRLPEGFHLFGYQRSPAVVVLGEDLEIRCIPLTETKGNTGTDDPGVGWSYFPNRANVFGPFTITYNCLLYEIRTYCWFRSDGIGKGVVYRNISGVYTLVSEGPQISIPSGDQVIDFPMSHELHPGDVIYIGWCEKDFTDDYFPRISHSETTGSWYTYYRSSVKVSCVPPATFSGFQAVTSDRFNVSFKIKEMGGPGIRLKTLKSLVEILEFISEVPFAREIYRLFQSLGIIDSLNLSSKKRINESLSLLHSFERLGIYNFLTCLETLTGESLFRFLMRQTREETLGFDIDLSFKNIYYRWFFDSLHLSGESLSKRSVKVLVQELVLQSLIVAGCFPRIRKTVRLLIGRMIERRIKGVG